MRLRLLVLAIIGGTVGAVLGYNYGAVGALLAFPVGVAIGYVGMSVFPPEEGG